MESARAPIPVVEVRNVLSSENLARHEYLYNVANKHVAHSVNDMELGSTTLHIALDNDGILHRGGIGRQGSGVGPFSSAGAAEAAELISELLAKIVTPKIAHLEAAVKRAISGMSDEEILALTDGSIPRGTTPHVDKKRNWPKRKKRK